MRAFLDLLPLRAARADVAFFFEFHRPPWGGGNQFLLALRGEFARRGLRVADNVISDSTRACLLNSFNFDFERMRAQRRATCRMVHRVDGPVSIYRGRDDGMDRRVAEANQEFADLTVFQSRYSLEAHRALGIELKAPVVIMNAVDPSVFYPLAEGSEPGRRKVRLIATSWSDNPNKGAPTYRWLEQHLDWEKFEFTFVGRSAVEFERTRTVAPVPSKELADLLRAHDVYIAASLHDPCSNALLEALACGLPAIYANSGGHPEIVGDAGLAFTDMQEIPSLLDRLVDEHAERREAINIPTLAEVATQYLACMEISA